MSWPYYVGVSAVYVAGLFSPSLRAWFDEVVIGEIKTRRKREEDTATHAGEVAATCYQALGDLRELLPKYDRGLHYRTTSEEDLREQERQIAVALRQLEDNLLLLPLDVRSRIRTAHAILKNVDQLANFNTANGEGPYHPHSVWRMARRTVDDAREVLAAFRRHEPLPAMRQSVYEYRIALRELEEQSKADFAREISEEETLLATWRKQHGVVGNEGRADVDGEEP